MEALCVVCASPQRATDATPLRCAVCGASYVATDGVVDAEPLPPKPAFITASGDTSALDATSDASPGARGVLVLGWRTGSSFDVALALLPIALGAGVLYWLAQRPGGLDADDTRLLTYGFGALGAFLLIRGILLALFGRCTFEAGQGRLRIVQRPWPPWTTTLETARIRQLFVRRHLIPQSGGRHHHVRRAIEEHLLCAVVDDRVRVLFRARDRERVVFLERALERHLGIPDQRTAVIPRPSSVHVEGSVGAWDEALPSERGPITLRWGWLGSGLAGDGLVVLVFTLVLMGNALFVDGASALRWVYAGLAVAVAGYWAVGRLVNRTTIVVTPSTITVRHGPLPWWGNASLERDRVRQLVVTPGLASSSGPRLAAIVGDARVSIASHGALDQLAYAEQVVERYLGIVDDPSADRS